MTTRDLEGRFIVITGSNTGIGRVTAERLAERGARVVLANRSEDKTRPVLDAIRASGGAADFVPLDLADLASVRAASAQILAMDRPLDVLVNNAGLAGLRGTTKDGFEIAFGTNHVGHFALTLQLFPALRRAGHARIVNVASKAHYRAKSIDWDAVRRPTASVTGLPEYQVSKLANVLFTAELARRSRGAGVHSRLWRPVHHAAVDSDGKEYGQDPGSGHDHGESPSGGTGWWWSSRHGAQVTG